MISINVFAPVNIIPDMLPYVWYYGCFVKTMLSCHTDNTILIFIQKTSKKKKKKTEAEWKG